MAAFRRDKDKEEALKAMTAEKQATQQLVTIVSYYDSFLGSSIFPREFTLHTIDNDALKL